MYVIIYFLLSHPTRDGWIEIATTSPPLDISDVPSHTGWVDWNPVAPRYWTCPLRPIPHGMGGLKLAYLSSAPATSAVPSHTGWVDWNGYFADACASDLQSHPTRDGWIEMWFFSTVFTRRHVPSHTGWVDWNSVRQGNEKLVTSPIPHGMGGLK